MGKGAKGKIRDVRDADVAKFPGVDGTLSPNATEQSAASYVDRIRLEGKIPKQVDSYYRTFMPKRLGDAPVPARHYEQSTMTLTQAEYIHYSARRNTDFSPLPPSAPFYEKLPAGTNFIIKYNIVPEVGGEHSFGVYSTKELDSKDVYNLQMTMRTYLVTRIQTRMGRSVLRETVSRFDIKTSPFRDDNGVLHQVKVVCDECGGNFKRDGRGDYVCMDCGLIYEKEDRFTPNKDDSIDTYDEFSFDYEEQVETPEDEESNDVPEQGGRKDSSELGSISDYTSMVEAKLAKHKAAWMAEIEGIPLDEAITKQRLHEEKVRHERAKKAFAKMGGYKVYMNKWSSMQASARKAKMLFFIKHFDMNTGTLAEVMNIGSKQFYKLLDELEQAGRIAMIKVKGVRSISLKYIERANYVPRVPKFKPHPVLLQVKYGGVQGKTINARRSTIHVL